MTARAEASIPKAVLNCPGFVQSDGPRALVVTAAGRLAGRPTVPIQATGRKNPERVPWVTGRRTPWACIAAPLAQTVVLLLLFVFISTNLAVLVLRKDHVEQEHFRAPTELAVAALASCVLLLTQQGPETWLHGGVLYLLTRMGAGSRTTANHDNERTERRSGNSASDAAPPSRR